MDYLQIMAFVTIAALLVVSPGPNGLLIARTVPASGKVAGFANIAGFLAAFYLHGSLSILGISVLLTKSAEAFFIFKVIGAIYLCWIGVKSFLGALNPTAVQEKALAKRSSTVGKSFLEGFLTNALNPKVSMFYLAAFPQFIPASENAAVYAFFLVSLHSLLNIVWFSSMVLLFDRLRSAAQNESVQRTIKAITGVVFIAFGAKLVALEQR